MDLKKPLSFQQQVDRLVEHGMYLDSKSDAVTFLSSVNYYRFTGYALQFRAKNGQDYIEGTSFEQVKEIYLFDEALRGILRDGLECVETMLRARIANGFAMAKCMEPPYAGHYDPANFFRPELHKLVLDSLQKEEKRHQDSLVIKHHQDKYDDKMPLWVMVELLSMSSLSTLYRAMYSSEQNAIAASCGKTRMVFANHMHVLSVLRNKCCHGARLYNVVFRPSVQLGRYYLKNHPEVLVDTLFAAVLALVRFLPAREAKEKFCAELCVCIEKYRPHIVLNCIGFPQNYKQLLKSEAEYV